MSSRLQQGCPSYFKEDDKLYHTANGELRRAQTLQGTPRQDITRSALDKLVRVPLLTLGPALMHDTAYQVSDVCIVASRLQLCCAPWLNSAGKLSSLIVILRIVTLVCSAVDYIQTKTLPASLYVAFQTASTPID